MHVWLTQDKRACKAEPAQRCIKLTPMVPTKGVRNTHGRIKIYYLLPPSFLKRFILKNFNENLHDGTRDSTGLLRMDEEASCKYPLPSDLLTWHLSHNISSEAVVCSHYVSFS